MKNLSKYLALTAAVALAICLQGDVGAATLTTRVSVNIGGSLVGTAGITTPTAAVSAIKTIDLANGLGAGQADKVYAVSTTIASAGTLSIDVQGSLTDAFGAAFTPAKLKVVYVYWSSGNTTNATLFGDAASVPILNTAATTSTLLPGGLFLMVQPPSAGIAVTATTADIIKIVNSAGATASVDVVLVGTSS